METRFTWINGVILVIVSLLLQATSSQNATDSTTVKLIPSTNSNSSIIKNSTTIADVISLKNSTENVDASKKDKRQAQRGYTDIPLDERSFNDQLVNSSPAPFQGFENQLPPLAEKSNNELTSSSNYLPNSVNANANFSPRQGFPSNLPKLDDPAAATSIIERRDDFFDTSEDGKPIPGEAGRDYPTFSSIPRTSFSCKDQAWPGYFADTEARCQVFWICQKHRMDAFLCPNGTLFNQQVFVCDWWFNVDCSTAPEYYSRNQFLYSGPGVGIDGSPTRSRRLPPTPGGDSGAANSFVNSVVPRPLNNNNQFVNQVQSSNQVPRVASVGLNQISRQQSPPPPPPQSAPYSNGNGNQHNGNYLASPSQQSQKHYPTPDNSNQISNQQQYPTSSEKYTSNQNMLANRMHKNPTNPTNRPLQSHSTSTENSFTGEYQQQPNQGVQNHQYNPASSNDVTRRVFANSDQNQIQVQYHTNQTVSTTRRPAEVVSIQTSSRPLSLSNNNNGPKLHVNIEPKGSNQQQQHAIVTFSGTISSTARPLSLNTEIPSYNHGSSTLQTPKDFGNHQNNQLNNQHQQIRQNNGGGGGYPPLDNNLNNHNLNGNGGYQQNSNNQNSHQNQNHNNGGSGYQVHNNNGHLTTSAPITTTFRSTSTTYSTHMRVVPQNHQVQLQQLQQSQPSPNPNNVNNRQIGSIGSLRPPSSTPSPNFQNLPGEHYNGPSGFIPPAQSTPTPVTSTLRPPGPPEPDLNDQKYVDRFGYVQNNQIQAPHQHVFVTSTTPQPQQGYSGPVDENGHLGQRANQYTNYNGQREVMYSPSSINANIEYPYSPSQQKNKQRRLELESLKSFRTSAKEMFSYPHFHGQRSNAYSEPDRIRQDDNQIYVDFEQTTPQTHPYHELPGENTHPSNFQVIHTTPRPLQHQVSENTHHQQIHHQSTPRPNLVQHHQNFGSPTPHPPQNHQNGNFGGPTPQPPPQSHQNIQQHHGGPTHQPQHHQNVQHHQNPPHHQNVQNHQNPQHFGTPTPHPQNHQNGQHHHVPHQPQQTPQNNFVHHPQPQQHQNFHPPQNHPQNHQQGSQPAFQHSQHPSGSVNVPHHVRTESPNQIHDPPPKPTPIHPNHQQFHKQIQPGPDFHQAIPTQSQQNHLRQNHNSPNHSPNPSPNTPFHQRIIVERPSQNLELPSFAAPDEEEHSRDGFTALKSGSFISIATASTASPPQEPAFSKQILHNQKSVDREPAKLRFTKAQKLHVFPSPTPPPNGLNYYPSSTPTPRPQKSSHQVTPSGQPGYISTLRPPPAHSTPSPFTNEAFSIAPKASPSIKVISPTPFTNQNGFLVAPTESSVASTSPGHRSNPYLPHNHGKRQKQQRQNPAGGQYHNSVTTTTTIRYPEGMGSLKVGVPGSSNTKRLVDFSYSAFPKGTTKSSLRSSTFPTVKERFNGVISGGGGVSLSSTTRRPHPQYHPSSASPSPQVKEGRRGRLAGSVVNKSTSSSTAIYVDSSATAESVSTPVSVPLPPVERVTPAPAVSTSNFGLKISTMAKKRMANAWQNYFGSGEKSNATTSNQNDESVN